MDKRDRPEVDDQERSAQKRNHRPPPAFRASLPNTTLICNALKALANGKKEQHALFEATDSELRITTNDAALCMQGIAVLSAKYFTWDFVEEACFRINVYTLLHCLTTLGEESTVHIAYYPAHEVLSIRLNENGIVTECKIKTLHDVAASGSDAINFRAAFRNAQVVNKCIVKSSKLKDPFAELSDLAGASTISILLSNEYPFFRISANGQLAKFTVVFPQGDEAFAKLSCTQEKECNYRLSLVALATKALSFADKTFIQMNAVGTLYLQHLLTQKDGSRTHVDFYILPDVDDTEANSDANSDDNVSDDSD